MPIYFNYAHYFHYFNEYCVCNHKSDILRYCKHLQMAFTKRGDAFQYGRLFLSTASQYE